MVVQLNRNQLSYFRRKALATPNEVLAMLIGYRASMSRLVVTSFVYPLVKSSAPSGITLDMPALKDLYATVAQTNHSVLGSIHSHPGCPPVMSSTDFNGHIFNNDEISGIVEVTNRRTRVVFWRHDSALPCDITYT